MKKLLVGIISILSLSVYSQSRYDLLENGKEKSFLSDSISKMAAGGTITNQPIIVINGKPYRYQDLEQQKLPLSKIEIEKIVALDKEKGISIYGSFGEAGVLIITTSKTKIFLLEDNDESKYYLVDRIKASFEKEEIANSPLIAIDGVPFKYDKNIGTIVLPLKKEIISDVTILNKNSSHVLYGKDEISGAIIINTTKQ